MGIIRRAATDRNRGGRVIDMKRMLCLLPFLILGGCTADEVALTADVVCMAAEVS